MFKNENEPIREKNHDVVLFLRIEPMESVDEKGATFYSLHLNMKSGMELRGKGKIDPEPVVISIGPILTNTLPEFTHLRARFPQHIKLFGAAQSLDLSGQKSGVLYLEDELGNTVKVTGKELSERLRAYSSIRLVILNACETAHSDDYGVAGALIYGGVPTVLGMRYTVSDEKAILFTSRFYTTISAGNALPRLWRI